MIGPSEGADSDEVIKRMKTSIFAVGAGVSWTVFCVISNYFSLPTMFSLMYYLLLESITNCINYKCYLHSLHESIYVKREEKVRDRCQDAITHF